MGDEYPLTYRIENKNTKLIISKNCEGFDLPYDEL